tara:strand:+ start:1933 stop:3813 length:1881 start_codon:yes stop_codon:yes gene_type:complete
MPLISGRVLLGKLKEDNFDLDNFSDFNQNKQLHSQTFNEDSKINVKAKFNTHLQSQSIKKINNEILISFIGEIYNEDGYESSFFEFIYDQYKKKSVKDFLLSLNGTFSLFLHDFKKNKTIIAVDRVSSKPLYFFSDKNYLYFSSIFKSFALLDSIDYIINFGAIADILTHGCIINNDTFFDSINKIPAGNYIEINKGLVQIIEYWNYKSEKASYVKSEKYYLEKFNNLLKSSIEKRIRRNINSAILLSGGFDSKAILANYIKFENSVKTVSYGFKNSKNPYSDYDISKKLSECYNTDHLHFEYDLANFSEVVQDVSNLSDSGARILPEFKIYDEVKEKLKVHRLFSGDHSLFSRLNTYYRNKKGVLEGACYIFSINSYNKKQFPISDKIMQKLIIQSENKIDSIINSYQNENLSDLSHFYYLNNYMIPIIGADRSTISKKIEIINPFYDSDLLDFYKSLPKKYKDNKFLFNNLVNNHFSESSHIPPARMTTKPNHKAWSNWLIKNKDTIIKSLNLVYELDIVCKENLELIYSKNNLESKKNNIHTLKKYLPTRNKINWINTDVKSEFIYSLFTKLLVITSVIIRFLRSVGLIKKKFKTIPNHTMLLNIYRIELILKVFFENKDSSK